MKRAVRAKKICHTEKLSKGVRVQAVIDGQHDGVIKKAGVKFVYTGILKNGEFPSWVECLEKDFKSEFSQLKEEKQKYYLNQQNVKKDSSANVDIEKLKAEIRAEMEAEVSDELKEKLRAEVAQEFLSQSSHEDNSENESSEEGQPANSQEGHVLHEPSQGNSIV
jgi:hypothetical protein